MTSTDAHWGWVGSSNSDNCADRPWSFQRFSMRAESSPIWGKIPQIGDDSQPGTERSAVGLDERPVGVGVCAPGSRVASQEHLRNQREANPGPCLNYTRKSGLSPAKRPEPRGKQARIEGFRRS